VNPEILLVETGISLVTSIVDGLKKSNATEKLAEALASGEAFLEALVAHKDDLITKDNLEAQRG